MKAVEFSRYGVPHEVCHCREVEPVGAPEPDEVVVAIEASPINPADLLTIEGRYPGPSSLPARLGIEGVGRIVACGGAAEGLAEGDRVMLMGRSNWAEQVRSKANQVVRLSGDGDPLQLAMLKANPPSALLMLRKYVSLEPGDWVIQNAANSAVGHHLVRLAKRFGLRTINVVRRPQVVERLVQAGADMVLLDGDDLAARVQAQTENAPVKLAIDAIGGPATQRLVGCLADGGTVVNYGFLDGTACQIEPLDFVTRDITAKGFWLVKYLSQMSGQEIAEMYGELAGYLEDGTLEVQIAATYGLTDIAEALKRAEGSDRDGKVLLLPNGPRAG